MSALQNQNPQSSQESKESLDMTPIAQNQTSQASPQSLTTSQRVSESLVEMAQTLLDTQTNTPTLKSKLKSRKFWLAAAGCIAGICGMIGFNDNLTAIIIFAVLEIVSIVAYCISEGMIDASRTKQLLTAAMTLIEIIGGSADAKEAAQSAVDHAKADAAAEDVENTNSLPQDNSSETKG